MERKTVKKITRLNFVYIILSHFLEGRRDWREKVWEREMEGIYPSIGLQSFISVGLLVVEIWRKTLGKVERKMSKNRSTKIFPSFSLPLFGGKERLERKSVGERMVGNVSFYRPTQFG